MSLYPDQIDEALFHFETREAVRLGDFLGDGKVSVVGGGPHYKTVVRMSHAYLMDFFSEVRVVTSAKRLLYDPQRRTIRPIGREITDNIRHVEGDVFVHRFVTGETSYSESEANRTDAVIIGALGSRLQVFFNPVMPAQTA